MVLARSLELSQFYPSLPETKMFLAENSIYIIKVKYLFEIKVFESRQAFYSISESLSSDVTLD